MKTVFADTSYWIALLYPPDRLHAKVTAMSPEISTMRLVTSELVLTELLTRLVTAAQSCDPSRFRLSKTHAKATL